MAYAPIHPLVGHGPVDHLMTPSSTQLFPLGMVLDAFDPWWGYGRFIYLKAGAAHVVGNLVHWDEVFGATLLPSTANQGFPFAVCHQTIASGAYGWYMLEGLTPVKVSASVATGVAIGIGTSAGLGGTYGTGKGLLGIRVQQASTYAPTVTGMTQNGSPIIRVNKLNGLFIGAALSGTGVGSGTIASIDPSQLSITSTANSTATGTVTVTATYTNYVLATVHGGSCTSALA